ncbi:MAG TPA: CAP domain-containing protein [Chryseosolibacter sp.]|nr:CAP domain-containing protein [Chryseosolibacter sp.]
MKTSIVGLVLMLAGFGCWAQKVSAPTGSTLSLDQAQEALDFHNKVRKDVGTRPLVWSAELAAYAQAWADSLAKWDCAMKHRTGEFRLKRYGENIYWSSSSAGTALKASKGWYSEIEKFVYGKLTPENWSGSGHYTQMVWSTTTAVGIGLATCEGGGTIIVANYDPPGNYMGEKPY